MVKIPIIKNNTLITNDGYQGFTVSDNYVTTPTSKKMKHKDMIISPNLSVKNKSVLDIGCYMGYFCFKSIELGANYATGFDVDFQKVNQINETINKLKLDKVKLVCIDFMSSKIKSDVVIFTSIIHCVSKFYSIQDIFNKLDTITLNTLIIEWIDGHDSMALNYQWCQNSSYYNKSLFFDNLNKHFSKIIFLGSGHHSKTREIYKCYK